MLDDEDIQFRVLELEYKDFLSRREVIHYAQWGVPLGWFTAVVAAGLVQDPYKLVGAIAIAVLLYAVVKQERVRHDLNLEALRIIISHLNEEEELPERLEPEAPIPLTTTDRFILFLLLVGFVSFIYFQGKQTTATLVPFIGILIALLAWFVERVLKTEARPNHPKRTKRRKRR